MPVCASYPLSLFHFVFCVLVVPVLYISSKQRVLTSVEYNSSAVYTQIPWPSILSRLLSRIPNFSPPTLHRHRPNTHLSIPSQHPLVRFTVQSHWLALTVLGNYPISLPAETVSACSPYRSGNHPNTGPPLSPKKRGTLVFLASERACKPARL